MLLSDWPAEVKCGRYPLVKIGSLRCHRKACESTFSNFASCPKLKHIVIVLGLAVECGWRSFSPNVELSASKTNQYGAGPQGEAPISIEVAVSKWPPPPLKLNALSHH